MRKVTPKIKALLRTRPYYSTSDLVRQCKTHVSGLSLATAHSGKTAWPSCRDPRRAHPADAGSSPWGAADVVTPLRFFFLRKRFASAIIQECVAGKVKEKWETDRMKP